MSDEATWYAQLSGRFWRHPKALSVSDAAGWLWTRALSYAVDNRTDGVIAASVLRALRPGDGEAVAAELVAIGLWEPHSLGYVFHDYSDHGMTVATWEAKKADQRERAARSREEKKKPKRGHKAVTRDKSVTQRDGHTTVTGDPSREDSGLRTQDSHVAESAGSTFSENLERLWRAWAKSYAEARGQIAGRTHGAAMADVCRVLTETAESRGETFDDVLERTLLAYWRDPWPRQHGNRATFVNLQAQLVTLLEGVNSDSDPPNYDPAKHGEPKDPENFAAYNAWLDRGLA